MLFVSMAPSIPHNFQEKIHNWLWIILLIGAIFYLHWLLVEMHVETSRLAQEYKKTKIEIEEEREKIRTLQIEFQAQIEAAIKDFIEILQIKEYPYYQQFYLKNFLNSK